MRLLPVVAWTFLALMFDIGAAVAQQDGHVYRIGFLSIGRPGLVSEPPEKWTGQIATFRDTLRDSGFVVGKNLVIDLRQAEGDVTRLAALAEALVASNPDVIVSPGTPSTIAAMQATKTLPIVFPGVGDPVEKGIVASLAKPGGNVTGIAVNVETSKLWQILRDIAPTTQRAGLLRNGLNNYANRSTPEFRALSTSRHRTYAAAAGIELVEMAVTTVEEIEPKFADIASHGNAAIYILTDETLFSWRSAIMAMASRHRLLTTCVQTPEWGAAGCLATYGEDPHDRMQRAAAQVVKILNGAKPADTPVEQPMRFKLIINTKTAKALGLTVPPSLLHAADEVIE
jgi:putative ABC transport system substrate-binding protein